MSAINLFFEQGVSQFLGSIQAEIYKVKGVKVELHTSVPVTRLPNGDPSGLEVDVLVAFSNVDERREFGDLLNSIGQRYSPPVVFHQYRPENYNGLR